MFEDHGQAAAIQQQQPESEQSPSEKIEGKPAEEQSVPGAESPGSKEIKQESNPNTE